MVNSVTTYLIVQIHSYFYYLRQGGYVFASVSLSVCVCVCVCHQHYAKSY